MRFYSKAKLVLCKLNKNIFRKTRLCESFYLRLTKSQNDKYQDKRNFFLALNQFCWNRDWEFLYTLLMEIRFKSKLYSNFQLLYSFPFSNTNSDEKVYTYRLSYIIFVFRMYIKSKNEGMLYTFCIRKTYILWFVIHYPSFVWKYIKWWELYLRLEPL